MATPSAAPQSCAIAVNVFSGARTLMPSGTRILLTLRNGNQLVTPLPNNGFFNQPEIEVQSLGFYNNFADNYSVIVWADGYAQAGFTPVKVHPQTPANIDVMLIPKSSEINFNAARWDTLRQISVPYSRLLTAGSLDSVALARYTQLMEEQPEVLACFFNLVTAMSQIHLPVGTPLDYIQQLVWDNSNQQGPKQDRFFAWTDPKLIDQVAQAAAQGQFAPELGPAFFHAGASRSWKQVQFGEANVQLTFHEDQKQTVNGIDCVVVEPDIDYYKDLGAHALLEVIPNAITSTLTDPRLVYVLRWIAGRHAGVPNFEPPYILQ